MTSPADRAALIGQLNSHQCGCGGPCGQQTPAYIREAADTLTRLCDDQQPMACEMGQITAAEDVLSWLLIEKLGCVDDRAYTPHEAQGIIAGAIGERASAEAQVAALKARVEKLEARLEIDHWFRFGDGDELTREEVPAEERDRIPDGIDARDATIKLQDERIAASAARVAAMERALKEVSDKAEHTANKIGLLLCVHDWKPNRAHLEGCRNEFSAIARAALGPQENEHG